jgi:hypothetical protein
MNNLPHEDSRCGPSGRASTSWRQGQSEKRKEKQSAAQAQTVGGQVLLPQTHPVAFKQETHHGFQFRIQLDSQTRH